MLESAWVEDKHLILQRNGMTLEDVKVRPSCFTFVAWLVRVRKCCCLNIELLRCLWKIYCHQLNEFWGPSSVLFQAMYADVRHFGSFHLRRSESAETQEALILEASGGEGARYLGSVGFES